MKYLRFFLFFILSSCASEEEELVNNSAPSQNTSDFFIKFNDGGVEYTYYDEGQISQSVRSFALEQGASFYATGMSFNTNSMGLGDKIWFQIVLPIDSSGMYQTPLNSDLLLNDSTNWSIGFGYLNLGAIEFEKSFVESGEDTDIREYNTEEYFNRITSISYLGNRRYDNLENLMLCDFSVQGDFKMRVKNDITSEIRVLSEGSYSLRVSIIAQ